MSRNAQPPFGRISARLLLEVSESIAEHRDLTVLFHQLAERLPRVIRLDSLWLVLHDAAANCMGCTFSKA